MLSESNSSSAEVTQRSNKRILGYFLAFCFALGAFLSGLQVGQGSTGYGQTASLFSLFASAPQEEQEVEPT